MTIRMVPNATRLILHIASLMKQQSQYLLWINASEIKVSCGPPLEGQSIANFSLRRTFVLIRTVPLCMRCAITPQRSSINQPTRMSQKRNNSSINVNHWLSPSQVFVNLQRNNSDKDSAPSVTLITQVFIHGWSCPHLRRFSRKRLSSSNMVTS